MGSFGPCCFEWCLSGSKFEDQCGVGNSKQYGPTTVTSDSWWMLDFPWRQIFVSILAGGREPTHVNFAHFVQIILRKKIVDSGRNPIWIHHHRHTHWIATANVRVVNDVWFTWIIGAHVDMSARDKCPKDRIKKPELPRKCVVFGRLSIFEQLHAARTYLILERFQGTKANVPDLRWYSASRTIRNNFFDFCRISDCAVNFALWSSKWGQMCNRYHPRAVWYLAYSTRYFWHFLVTFHDCLLWQCCLLIVLTGNSLAPHHFSSTLSVGVKTNHEDISSGISMIGTKENLVFNVVFSMGGGWGPDPQIEIFTLRCG